MTAILFARELPDQEPDKYGRLTWGTIDEAGRHAQVFFMERTALVTLLSRHGAAVREIEPAYMALLCAAAKQRAAEEDAAHRAYVTTAAYLEGSDSPPAPAPPSSAAGERNGLPTR